MLLNLNPDYDIIPFSKNNEVRNSLNSSASYMYLFMYLKWNKCTTHPRKRENKTWRKSCRLNKLHFYLYLYRAVLLYSCIFNKRFIFLNILWTLDIPCILSDNVSWSCYDRTEPTWRNCRAFASSHARLL